MSSEHSPADPPPPRQRSPRLPPPPYWSESPKLSPHGLYVPLPPCPFQPLARSFPRRRFRREEDPFLAAYLECTKSGGRQGKASEKSKRGGGLGSGFGFSCKHVCGVEEDGIVRLSQLPSLPARERFLERRWRQRNLYGHGSLYR